MSNSANPDRPTPIISVRDVSKSYGGVHALKGVSFDVRRGIVHGLVGANGAGKSTLIRCLAGVAQRDSGSIEIDGRPEGLTDPREAARLGLAFIHQEMSLISGWDVLRNLAVGTDIPTRAGIIDWRPVRRRARAVAERLDLEFPLTRQVDELTTAQKWLVMIGRALMTEAKVIVMDEPTASLSEREAARLHVIIRDLVAEGSTVLFVSHRLDEVSDLCDDVTVFRDGTVSLTVAGKKLTKDELVRAIVGRDVEIPDHGRPPAPAGRTVLEVRGLADGAMVKDVSLSVHAGQVVGIGGLVGSGRSELAAMVYGAARPRRGEIRLDGERVHFSHPSQAVAAGIGLVPEERRAQGVFLDESIAFNIAIARVSDFVRARAVPLVNPARIRSVAQSVTTRVQVKARSVAQQVGDLSGGNQQKVAIARWLVKPPRLLVLDEPSRGVDVGARAEVHAAIRALADGGAAVLVISSDNEELVALCDTVVVMREGRVVGGLEGQEISVDRLLHLSFGQGPRTSGGDR